MFRDIFVQSWIALRRSPTRSLLTMLGVVWGIAAVTLLIAYGSGFRTILVHSFEQFGKSAVIVWPGQTSSGPGGQRAGRRIRLEQADVDAIKYEAPLVKQVCMETVRWLGVTHQERVSNSPVRGVCPEYGEVRNQVPTEGRWINAADLVERRRVVFIGGKLREKLFGTRPAVGQEITISGMRFTVIGYMEPKMQMSNYFGPDDGSAFIPYTTAGDLWNNRYASVLVFSPVAPQFEAQAIEQARAALARRQAFSANDKRAVTMMGRQEVRPIIDGITIGLQILLGFIGALTLGIGGVGVMNIMLVSVDERIREIGLRRALGARRWHIRAQFLCEALLLMLLGGAIGIAVSYAVASLVGPLPMLDALFESEDGKGAIHLQISAMTVLASSGILVFVGVLSGMVPALRASRLDPVVALRYE